MSNSPLNENILFFDGYCNLCNSSVDWFLRHDKKAVFKFASLQSLAARDHLPDAAISDLASVVLKMDGQLYTESSAILRALGKLGWPWKLLKVFLIVPAPIRNAIYRLIARNRYQLFGRRDTYRLPSPTEKERFLDQG